MATQTPSLGTRTPNSPTKANATAATAAAPSTSTSIPSPAPARTLADVLVRLAANNTLDRQRRQDLASAVRSVARVLGAPPEAIDANTEVLGRRIAPISHAMAGLTKSRWRNVRSAFAAALAATNVTIMRRRRKELLSPSWKALIERVPDRYERARLSRFFSWCSTHAIEIHNVDAAVVERFAAALLSHTLVDRPKQIHRELAQAWNRCCATIDGWPPVVLPVPNASRAYALPMDDYPASFAEDVNRYLGRLAGGDLFDDQAPKPMAPTTLRDIRARIGQLAAAIVLAGKPADTINSLADLVDVTNAKTALTHLFERNGRRKTGQLANFINLLIKIAKHHVKAPIAQLEDLRAMRRKLDPAQSGMTERNRRRLRQFDDPENVRRLLDYPARVFAELPNDQPPSYGLAVRVQSALAVAILLVAPLRVANIAGLHLERHLVRPRATGPRHMIIPADEVKNAKDLEFQLPDDISRLLDRYLTCVRPVLLTDRSTALFPRRMGGAKPPAQLAAQIKRDLLRHCGVDLNVHAFRHLAAKLFLERHPGEYATVQLLLGHKNVQTTVRSYSGLELGDAVRRYDALIDALRRDPPEPRHGA